jgi:hypothetical protein
MATDACCNTGTSTTESPLACDLTAISATDRPRYNELRRILASSAIAKRDLPNGIAIQIAPDKVTLPQLAEWISMERKCCPFFNFKIEVAPDSGPVHLTLTGPPGIKEFLASAFSA